MQVYSSAVGPKQTLLVEFNADTKKITYHLHHDNDFKILPDDFKHTFNDDASDDGAFEDLEMKPERVNAKREAFMVPIQEHYNLGFLTVSASSTNQTFSEHDSTIIGIPDWGTLAVGNKVEIVGYHVTKYSSVVTRLENPQYLPITTTPFDKESRIYLRDRLPKTVRNGCVLISEGFAHTLTDKVKAQVNESIFSHLLIGTF